MLQLTTRATQILMGILIVAATLSVNADGPAKLVATGQDNVALKGYDPVAYFIEGRPMRGDREFAFLWNEAEWRFSSARHRDLFTQDPERYAPQFGGYCANGLSKGKTVVADPEAWTIVDGKLYVKFSEVARDEWRKDKAARIPRAEENWAKHLKQE